MDWQAWEIIRGALIEAGVPESEVDKLPLSKEQVGWLNRAQRATDALLMLVVELVVRIRRLEEELESLRGQAEQQCHGCSECGLD